MLNELAKALNAAQAEIKHAEKDAQNPHFRSDYSTLAAIWDAARGPLTRHGLSVAQTQRYDGETIVSVTTLMHHSGQSLISELPLFLAKRDMQALGSAITYARRYQLAAIAGISSDDDDGESSMDRPPAPPRTSKPKPQAPAPAPASFEHEQFAPIGTQGVVSNDTFTIQFGKYEGKRLSEVPVAELRGYASFIRQNAEKKGQALGGVVADFLARVDSL